MKLVSWHFPGVNVNPKVDLATLVIVVSGGAIQRAPRIKHGAGTCMLITTM